MVLFFLPAWEKGGGEWEEGASRDGSKQEKEPGLDVLQRLNQLLTLPNLCLSPCLVRPDTLEHLHLFVVGEKPRPHRAIREHDKEPDPDNEGQPRTSQHQELPAGDARTGTQVGRPEGQEARDDVPEPVALDSPSDALAYLPAGVEHREDDHDAVGYTAL